MICFLDAWRFSYLSMSSYLISLFIYLFIFTIALWFEICLHIYGIKFVNFLINGTFFSICLIDKIW